MKLNLCKPVLKSTRRVTRGRCLYALPALLFLSLPSVAQAQEDDQSRINAAVAQKAVMQILPTIPKDVGLTPKDYISGNDHRAGKRLVQVQIGPEGQIMPSADWQKTHPEQCAKQARETNKATQILEFEMHVGSDDLDGLSRSQYTVFVRLKNADTGIVKHQAEGESTVGQASTGPDGLMENPDFHGLVEPLNDALKNLGADIGAPEDGCGDIRLEHLSGTQVDEEFAFVAGEQNKPGPNVEYTWDFGDGSAGGSGDQIGRHTYGEKGAYTVTVQVSGEGVRKGSASIGITVKEEEEDEGGAIQPKDGTWAIKLISHEMEGCSPKIASGVKATLTKTIGKQSHENLEFPKPFHPEPLMKHAKKLAWEQTGKNTWKTVVSDQSGTGMTQKVVLDAEVVSPTLIKEVLNHTIVMSGPLAKILGGSGHCLATGKYELTWEN